jgi:hypothetical protein
MPETERTSLMLRPDQKEIIEDMAESDDPRWDNQSEALRHLIDESQRVDDLEDEIDDLRMATSQLRNEKQVLIEDREQQQETSDETDMVPADNNDRSIIGRLSWLLRGR